MVTSVSPATVSAGGPAFTLTVNGTNFVATSVVKWGGADRTTTFVNGTQLAAAIEQGDLSSVGTATVTVTSPAPGGGTSNAMTVTIGNPAPALSRIVPVELAAGGSNFVLTAHGLGFIDGAVIHWNGTARTTTFVTAQALQTAVSASDVALASLAEITVTNPGVGGGTSNPQTLTIKNPSPLVFTLSPSLVVPGSGALDLIINGTGFVPTSVAKRNGADRATTFVSASQLRIAIRADEVAAQNIAQITVVNAGPGGGTSNAVRLFSGNPVPQITGIEPGIVRTGSAPFVLRVFGSVFADGARVHFHGRELEVGYFSDTEVQGVLLAQDLAADDLAEVVVVNPPPAGGVSNTAILTISQWGVTQRVSVANDGSQANGASAAPSTSASGRYVAFTSEATNLVGGDSNAVQDIFVRDTCIGATGCTPSTVRVSVSTNGTEANAASALPSISGDGRFVAFESTASNLVPGDSNAVADIFLRDTCAGAGTGCTPATTRVSVGSDESQGNLKSINPSLSANGRFVAFVSENVLVLGDVRGWSDAFVRDTCFGAPMGCTPTTMRASAALDAEDAANPDRERGMEHVAISADGRFVAYLSEWSPGTSTHLRGDLHVADTCAGAGPACVASDMFVTQFSTVMGDMYLFDRAISADGRFVVYTTFVVAVSRISWLADTCRGAPPSCNASFIQLPSEGSSRGITPDGRFVGFRAGVEDVCIGAPAGCMQARVKLTPNPPPGEFERATSAPSLNASGQWAAFTSGNTYLVAGDTNGVDDIFIGTTGFVLR